MNEPVRVIQQPWDDERKAEFLRRRRARNYLLLATLGGFCLVVYVITLVKLHGHGTVW